MLRTLVGLLLLTTFATAARAEETCSVNKNRIGPCYDGDGWVYRSGSQVYFVSQLPGVRMLEGNNWQSRISVVNPFTVPFHSQSNLYRPAPDKFRLVSQLDKKQSPILPPNVANMLAPLTDESALKGRFVVCPLSNILKPDADGTVLACLASAPARLTIVKRFTVVHAK